MPVDSTTRPFFTHVKILGAGGFPCPNPTRPEFPPGDFDDPCDGSAENLSFTLTGSQTYEDGTRGPTTITYSGQHVSVSSANTLTTPPFTNGPAGLLLYANVGSGPALSVPAGFGVCFKFDITTTMSGFHTSPLEFGQFDFATGWLHSGPNDAILTTNFPNLFLTTPHIVGYVRQVGGPYDLDYFTRVQLATTFTPPSDDPRNSSFTAEIDLTAAMFHCDYNFSNPLDNELEEFFVPPTDSPSRWQQKEYCGAKFNQMSNGFDILFNPTGDCYFTFRTPVSEAVTTGNDCETVRITYDYEVVGDPAGVDINTYLFSLNQHTGNYLIHTEIPTASSGSVTDTYSTLPYHPWSNLSGRQFCIGFLVGFSGTTPASTRIVRLRNIAVKGWTTS